MSRPAAKLDRLAPEDLKGNSRATLGAWLKYEPIVKAAYANHPKSFTYQPTSMAASTVATRLRDAIRGAIAFDYPSEISNLDLRRWYAEVVIKHTDDQVFIGPVDQVVSAVHGFAVSKDPFIFEHLTLDELIAFTILLSSGRVVGPVCITHPPDISMLPTRDNVEVIPRADGSLLLL